MLDEEAALAKAMRAYGRMRKVDNADGIWDIIPDRRWCADLEGNAWIVSGYMNIYGGLPIEDWDVAVRYRVTVSNCKRLFPVLQA